MGAHGELAKKQYRYLSEVQCSDCGARWQKRRDSIRSWGGRCASCEAKRKTTLPGAKERLRANGIAVMARVGKLPHYPDRNYRRGPANNKWRGGITPESQKIRLSPEMKAWRIAVFERDQYTCALCGKRGGDMHADHIRPFALHPELRFDIDNGRTLCVPCHRKYGALVSNGVLTRAPVLTLEAV
jgi:5-methylcytosine-specific restriction endonuclease McrA